MYYDEAPLRVLEAGWNDSTRDLKTFLAKAKVPKELITFLWPRISFAYPRALWLRLEARSAPEVKLRQELSALTVGRALAEWMERKAGLARAVFDLRGITIIDLDSLMLFCDELLPPRASRFYLCDPALVPALQSSGLGDAEICTKESDVLAKLRDDANLRRLTLTFCDAVFTDSLNGMLKKRLTKQALKQVDVVEFDLMELSRVDFLPTVMLPALIHSLARRHGVLARVLMPASRTLVRDNIRPLGLLRGIAGYMLNQVEKEVDHMPAIFPLETFTQDEIDDLMIKTDAKFNEIFRTFSTWVGSVTGTSRHTSTSGIERRAQSVKKLMGIVKELLENVVTHSQGLGFVAMQFDAHKGLLIYVGDSGVGLANGLKAKYKFGSLNSKKAACLALSLKEHREKRKPFKGMIWGGRGLEKIAALLAELDGIVTIRTGDVRARFDPRQGRQPSEAEEGLYLIEGTHFEILIPTHKEIDASSLSANI